MADVLKVDFGKEQRESARKLARLLKRAADRDAQILADPKPFLDQAHDEIVRLQAVIEGIADVLWHSTELTIGGPSPIAPGFQTVTITKNDYDRFKAVEALVRNCVA